MFLLYAGLHLDATTDKPYNEAQERSTMRRNVLSELSYEDQIWDDLTTTYPGWPRHLMREASKLTANILACVELRADAASEEEMEQYRSGRPLILGTMTAKIHHGAALLVLERLHVCKFSSVLEVHPRHITPTLYAREEQREAELHTASPLVYGGPYILGTATFPWERPDLISVRPLRSALEERPPWRRRR